MKTLNCLTLFNCRWRIVSILQSEYHRLQLNAWSHIIVAASCFVASDIKSVQGILDIVIYRYHLCSSWCYATFRKTLQFNVYSSVAHNSWLITLTHLIRKSDASANSNILEPINRMTVIGPHCSSSLENELVAGIDCIRPSRKWQFSLVANHCLQELDCVS